MSSDEPYTATYGNEDLDVYRAPDDARDRPLIVYVHGGAWRSESKEEHRELAIRLRDLTACPVAVLDYRLTKNGNELKHPAHAKDVLDALHFLIKWPDGAPFDHTRLYLVGHSAGAHMLTSIFLDASDCVSYLPHYFLKPDEALLRAVQGIAIASGIYDLEALMQKFPHYEKQFLRAAFRDPYEFWNTTRYPLHANSSQVRWFVVHSTDDPLVDLGQSEAIYAHLVRLYEDKGWPRERVTKFWDSLGDSGHFYVKGQEFARLIGEWVKRDIDEAM